MIIQVCAPTSNAEEAEVEQFYEDLQDLLELTPEKMSFSLWVTGMQKYEVPCGSDSKESAYNEGELGTIPT